MTFLPSAIAESARDPGRAASPPIAERTVCLAETPPFGFDDVMRRSADNPKPAEPAAAAVRRVPPTAGWTLSSLPIDRTAAAPVTMAEPGGGVAAEDERHDDVTDPEAGDGSAPIESTPLTPPVAAIKREADDSTLDAVPAPGSGEDPRSPTLGHRSTAEVMADPLAVPSEPGPSQPEPSHSSMPAVDRAPKRAAVRAPAADPIKAVAPDAAADRSAAGEQATSAAHEAAPTADRPAIVPTPISDATGDSAPRDAAPVDGTVSASVQTVTLVASPAPSLIAASPVAPVRPPGDPAPTEQVAVRIAQAIEDERTTIQLQLEPPELGHLEITLDFDGDRLEVVVQSARDETLNALQRDQGSLARALQEAGIGPQSVTIRFEERGRRSSSDTDARSRRAGGDRPAAWPVANAVNDPMPQPWSSGRLDMRA